MNGAQFAGFRHFDEPRRHVPRIVYVDNHPEHAHPIWQMSVRDYRNVHHVRCADTWPEAVALGHGWTARNAAHNCRVYPPNDLTWAD